MGGRGTLVGALVGAALVNLAKSWFTVALPEYWLYVLGFLFIAVTLFMPQGVVGLLKKRKSSKPQETNHAEPEKPVPLNPRLAQETTA